MGKSTNYNNIFNSYVKLPEGNSYAVEDGLPIKNGDSMAMLNNQMVIDR